MAMHSPLPPRDGVGATRLRVPRTGPWETIADYVVSRFGHVDPDTLRARFERGEVVGRDGAALSIRSPLGAADFIWYYREPPVEREIPFDIEILHQDDDLVVIDKPHFLPTTPSGRFLQNSALVRLRNRLDNPDLTPIHRLDRHTAGLVMFSARPQTRGAYQTLFERREVEKEYEAISHPPTEAPEFPLTVRSHIRKERGVLRVQEIPDAAPNAETVIELISADARMLRTRLRPHTGQMHQLRVHLASIGAGIRNDPFYPELLPEAPDDFTKPLQLLARELRFVDPLSGDQRVFTTRLDLSGA
ncbi:pseudouridine synthase [Microbacterium sp. NIBRBAC000506063]|uniref:pseudouridine synthase n=1 Tax=Microbacterium sp. NIBRBAC000506063 TaxID=2734618 RepID=UPI001BB5C612|nr:pseudouridine synthase [Microbacterium sp. NIBRBAC000506063]QTV79913.1 pseudouridine synthase [Microbacterium sp. NIBRBAC000506063]